MRRRISFLLMLLALFISVNGQLWAFDIQPVTQLVANRQGPNIVSLSWQAPSTVPLSYNIYRSEVSGFTPAINNMVINIDGINTSWTDEGVLEGYKYYYIIASVGEAENLAFSQEVVAGAQAYYLNVLENAGFEVWEDNKPVRWGGFSKAGSVTADNMDKREGNYSLRIENLANTEYNCVIQRISVNPNTNYTFIGWVKCENVVKGAGAGAKLFVAKTTGIGIRTCALLEGTVGWTEYKVEFNSGDNSELDVYAYLHQSTGRVWFDGIVIYESIDGTPPESPNDLVATRINGTTYTNLSWSASPQAPDGDLATKYRLYRGSNIDFVPDTTNFLVEISAETTNWVDEESPTDGDVYYLVTAIDKVGHESDPSDVVMIGKTGTVRGSIFAEIDSEFEPLSGVDLLFEGTELSVKSTEDGSFEFNYLLAETYSLLAKKTDYKTKKIIIELGEGATKNLGQIMLERENLKPVPQLVASRQGPNTVSLSWQTPSSEPVSYNIYRSEVSGFTPAVDNLVINIAGMSTSWVDEGVLEGCKYYYIIASVGEAENLAFSQEVVAGAQAYYLNVLDNAGFEVWEDNKPVGWTGFSKPGSVTADNIDKHEGNYSLRIENLANTEYNCVIQSISVTPNTNYTIMGWAKSKNVVKGPSGLGGRLLVTKTDGNTFKTIAIFEGTSDWDLYIGSFNSGAQESLEVRIYLHQSTGSVWFDELVLYESIDGTPPESPNDLVATRINGTTYTNLSWSASPQAPDGDLATKYRLYRGSNIDFVPDTTNFLVEISAETTNWVDEESPTDSNVYYLVTAIDKVGHESDPSDVAMIRKTGNVRGSIFAEIDSKLGPLAGVALFFEGTELSTESIEDGSFEFNYLLAETYSFLAKKTDYKTKKITVELGEGETKDLGQIILEWENLKPVIQLVASRQGPNTVSLSWQVPSTVPLSYNIYRSEVSGFTPAIDNLVINIDGINTSWTDEGVLEGCKYYYIIASVGEAESLAFSQEVVAGAQAYYLNLLENAGFEVWENNKPVGWTGFSRTGSVTTDNLNKHEGNYSLRIENLANTEYNCVIQTISVNPNTDYTIMGWAKSENVVKGPSGLGGRLLVTKTDGNTFKTIAVLEGTSDWDLYIGSFNSGAQESLEVRIYLHQSTGSVWFDGLILYESIDGTPPESPKDLVATRTNGTTQTNLSWSASPQAPDGDYATKYRIYRGNSIDFVPDTTNFLVEVSSKKTNWVDNQSPTDSDAYYLVTAIDKVGHESDPSDVVMIGKTGSVRGSIYAEIDSELGPLAGVALFFEGTELSTESIEDGSFEFNCLVAETYSLLIRTKGYKLKEFSFDLDEGEVKELDQIILELDNIKPNKPRNLVADGESYVGAVSLTWNEPESAEDGEIANSYNIYRSSVKNVERVPAQLIATVNDTNWVDVFNEKDFDRTFCYVIEAVDSAGNISIEGTNIASASVRVPPIPTPVSPVGKELILDQNPIFVWSEVEAPGLIGYFLELCDDKSFPKDKILSVECGLEKTYQWDEQLPQKIWYWRITARFVKGVASSASIISEFVLIKSIEDNHALPYINVTPKVFTEESVVISYLLNQEANITLRVFNLGGKLIDTLEFGHKVPGYYRHNWKGQDVYGRELINGLYFIQLICDFQDRDPIRTIKKIIINR